MHRSVYELDDPYDIKHAQLKQHCDMALLVWSIGAANQKHNNICSVCGPYQVLRSKDSVTVVCSTS